MAHAPCHLILIAFVIASLSGISEAVMLGQIDDFEDGTFQNWTQGSGDGGELPGDNVNGLLSTGVEGFSTPGLIVETNGFSFAAGSNLAVFNTDQWTGDYFTAGVSAVQVDLLALTLNSYFIRLGINGPGGPFVTDDVFFTRPAIDIPGTVSFSLAPQDLIAAGGNDVMATLANVTQLRILHNPIPRFQGTVIDDDGVDPISPVAGRLFIDNIIAVPEPSTFSMLTVLFAILLAVARRRVRTA